MKIIVNKILSLSSDGACSYILSLGNQVKILLDCGISHDFNFQSYQKHRSQIQSVNLILISHSSIQYSGALPFLISQFNIDPKIVYTTQPIMRYAPLNFHQQLVNFRNQNYNKKVFNEIYTFFESIQLIKPYQKKVITIQSKNQLMRQATQKSVHFSCYQAGGSLGSLYWKIHFGLINIIYLVQYNNYFLNHINGLDLEAIKQQPINLMLTDMYENKSDQKLKKDSLYMQIKRILLDFYSRNAIDPTKPRALNESDRKLLITCYPNQMLIQIMITLKKVINDLQEAAFREKIVVVHLSSRFLQLIKSQVEFFSEQAKPIVDKIDEYFIHSKSLMYRINVASVNQIQGILNPVIANSLNIQTYHFGQQINENKINLFLENAKQNIKKFKLFKPHEQQQTKLKFSDQFIKKQQIQQQQQNNDPFEQKIQEQVLKPFESFLKHEKQNIAPQPQINPIFIKRQSKQISLVGKYLSQISFPHFIKSYQEQQYDFNDYGLKHHLQASGRPAKKTINDLMADNNQQIPQLSLISKKSTVQVMNIEFGLDQKIYPIDYKNQIRMINFTSSKTNFNSSIKIIQILKPNHVFFINSSNDHQTTKLFHEYKANCNNQLFNLAANSKNQCIVEVQNQLMQYKVNYLHLGQNQLQKVKGRVQSVNGIIHLHIQILQEKQILEFRLEKFYRECKKQFGRGHCKFTGNGIMIAGIKIYRQGNEIIFEGAYSESYFKVRKVLYNFLKIR